MVITLKEALIGFEKEIVHLDGHKVPIKKNGVSQPGEVIRIKKRRNAYS
jgi:DnaJ-class molecular chaperone